MENLIKTNTLIEQLIDESVIQALAKLSSKSDSQDAKDAAVVIASAFNADDSFKEVIDGEMSAQQKLLHSFHKNLQLLVQKTWVEQSDIDLKEQVLFRLEELCKDFMSKPYSQSYIPFFTMLDDAVYLMFGVQTQTPEFAEYALRIDPEFGIFWWYIKSLPRTAEWDDEKCRIALLLGMYFLANY